MIEVVSMGTLFLFIIIFLFFGLNKNIYNPILYLIPYMGFIYLCSIYRTFYGFDGVRITSFILDDNPSERVDVYFLYVISFCYMLLLSLLTQNITSHSVANIKSYSINNGILILINFMFLGVAFLNFLYVSNYVSDGFFSYFINLRVNAEAISKQGISTIGYNLVYVSIVITIIAYASGCVTKKHLFFVLFVSFIIVLSKARITQLSTDVLFVSVLYLRVLGIKLNFKRICLMLIVVAVVAISAFSFRYISDMYRVGLVDELSLDNLYTIFQLVFDKLINQGNLPNYSSFYAMYHAYGEIIDFRYGETIIAPFFNLLPLLKNIIPEVFDVTPTSIEFKGVLFPLEPGQGFPPSLFGDFYANGGVIALFLLITIMVFIFSFLYRLIIKSTSIFPITIGVYMLTKIVFILPKGEMARFNNLNILIIIIPIIWFVVYCFFREKNRNDLSHI